MATAMCLAWLAVICVVAGHAERSRNSTDRVEYHVASVGSCPKQRTLMSSKCVYDPFFLPLHGALCVSGGKNATTKHIHSRKEYCPDASRVTLVHTSNGIAAWANDMDIEAIESLPPGLQVLDLSGNQLDHFALADDTGDEYQLHSLDLSSNTIHSVSNIRIPSSLRSLDISSNHIRRLEVHQPKGKLTTIACSNNLIESANLSNTSVSTLILQKNHLHLFKDLELPDTIEELDISYNDIRDWPNQSPANLKILYASMCGIKAIPNLQPSIEVLDFSDNHIVEISNTTWPSKLRILDLRGNPIQRVQVRRRDFKILSSLSSFYIDPFDDQLCNGTKVTKEYLSGISICVEEDGSLEDSNHNSPANVTKGSTPGLVAVSMIACGAIVAICVIILVGLCIRKRSYAKYRETEIELEAVGPDLPSDVRNDPELASHKLKTKDIRLVKRIRSGSIAQYYLVKLHSKNLVMKCLQKSMVKKRSVVISFMEEIRLHSKLEHHNIVTFRGFVGASLRDLGYLTDYESRGTVNDLITTYRESENLGQWSWLEYHNFAVPKLKVVISVASALQYLHDFENPICHGRLSPSRLLVGDSFSFKLCGLGRDADLTEEMSKGLGSISWVAPEVLRGGKPSLATDIYAVGFLFVELDTVGGSNVQPTKANGAAVLTNAELAQEIVHNRFRPSPSESCPAEIQRLTRLCMSDEPDQRPSAKSLVVDLLHLMESTHAQSSSSSAYSFV